MAEGEPLVRPKFLLPDNRYILLVPKEYQVGDERHHLTELQLRRLDAADMIEAEKPGSNVVKVIAVLERMTGLLPVVLKKLDAVDIDRIDECFGYFREPGSVTGAIS